MKLVLISAPYSSVGSEMREDITRTVEAASMLLWENGIAVICPHLNSGHFTDHQGKEVKHYRNGYVEIAKRCDAVLAIMPGRKAPGQMEELATMKQRGKPVFLDVKKVLKWHTKED